MTPETLARLTALRHDLHREPELSGEEGRTAHRMAAELSRLGADRLWSNIGGHGVAAEFRGRAPGPTVAIRCELDALPIAETIGHDHVSERPGKGHLCGHDGHMAMVLGVAERLAERRPDRGRAVLIFQPAEETGKGAAAIRADPRFAELAPDIVLSLHNLPGLPLGQVELCAGPANCASRGMRIRLAGKTSHASAPEDGLSPADAIARLMPALAALGPGGDPGPDYARVTLTHVRLGQATFGVAPGEGELWVTLRTVADARMRALVAAVSDLSEKTAAEFGLGMEIAFDDIFEASSNHPEAVAALQSACAAEAVPCTLTDRPQVFSEDFGQFGKSARAAMFWLGAGEAHPRLHHPDYDFPDALIPVGVAVFDRAIRQLLAGG